MNIYSYDIYIQKVISDVLGIKTDAISNGQGVVTVTILFPAGLDPTLEQTIVTNLTGTLNRIDVKGTATTITVVSGHYTIP